MLAPRPRRRDPIVPANTRERTGSAGILRRASADIRRRFAGFEADVLALFASIPTLAANDAAAIPRTIYTLTPEQLGQVAAELQRAVERWFASGRDPAQSFWWSVYDAEASQLGTAQTVANLSALSPSYAAERSLQAVLFSEPYRNRLASAQIRSMEHWTGLGAQMRADLAQIIGRAVVDGKNPKSVRAEIAERLEVSKGRALGYAQTDITGTLREARWAEADHARDEMGIATGLLHTSALLPTTRDSHAARNGKVFTTAEVRAWYERDGNRYRCFLPGTKVAGRFSAGIKSRYQGPAVRLMTAAGNELAVTANHPVLTARGMVPAAEIRKGDQLVAYQGQHERLAARVRELHGDLVGARIEDVFCALVQAGHQFAVRVSPVDLHGDARFCEPDVDVVGANRELVFGLDTAASQLLDDLALVHADAARTSSGASDSLGGANLAHSGDEVGRRHVSAPLLGAELCHSSPLPIASVPDEQAEVGERAGECAAADASASADRQDRLAGQVIGVERPAPFGGPPPHPIVQSESRSMEGLHNRAVADAKAVTDVLQRFAGLAAFDEVRDVVLFEYSGHVFDLQERSGLLLAGNIVASNCHCSQTECLLDEDGQPMLSPQLRRTMQREREVWERQHGG